MVEMKITRRVTKDHTGPLAQPRYEERAMPLVEFMTAVYVPEFYDAVGFLGVVPPLQVVNELLCRPARDAEVYDWSPRAISQAQFLELQHMLCERDPDYCIVDESLWDCPDYDSWRAALTEKIRANPQYKPLKFGAQHAVLGIPLGEGQWLRTRPIDKARRGWNVDPLLFPLRDFLLSLTHCTPYCCGIEAFAFDREMVDEHCDRFGRSALMGALDRVLLDLENHDAPRSEVHSDFMNCSLHVDDLIELLRHLQRILGSAV